ncbi:transmembrane and coiled-coil domain protein 3-like isoform X2 [Engraulis encrasicolus]|uniref:transmembrane and coiled-coil domain protein 3-like isoform X2 n=1 Tax=Engraulis encrasicolus TaxID=184585 RepID=UPI002FCEA560
MVVIMPSAETVTGRSLAEVQKYQRDRDKAMERSEGGYVLSIPVPVMRRGGSDTHLELERSTSSASSHSQHHNTSSSSQHHNTSSSSSPYAHLPDFRRSRSSLSSLQQKILKVTEQLRIEQTERDKDVAEYLKLINSADKQQASRIRQVFEKKHQKSTQTIANLQRKLEQYHRRMKDSEGHQHSHNSSNNASPATSRHNNSTTSTGGSSSTGASPSLSHSTPNHAPGSKIRDLTGSGRHPTLDKIKTIGPGVSLSPPFFFSKPREFANLIRNKFGSADNIAHLKTSLEVPSGFQQEGAAEASRSLSNSANLVDKVGGGGGGASNNPSDDECSTGTSVSADSNGNPLGGPGSGVGAGGGGESLHGGRVDLLLEEMREIREAQGSLAHDMEGLKERFKTDYSFLTETLQEERYRYERLEDQLNDLTELHQHEMANLKQVLASIEEKVAYQANERARDLTDALEACQTRVSKLELQQQQQQAVQWESSGDARVLLGRCINILLALATVVLVFVSTAAKFTAPMLRSRLHLLATTLGLLLLVFCWKHWDQLQCVVERLLLPS